MPRKERPKKFPPFISEGLFNALPTEFPDFKDTPEEELNQILAKIDGEFRNAQGSTILNSEVVDGNLFLLTASTDTLVVTRQFKGDGDDNSTNDVAQIIKYRDHSKQRFITFAYRKDGHFASVVIDKTTKTVHLANSSQMKDEGEKNSFLQTFITNFKPINQILGEYLNFLITDDSEAVLQKSDNLCNLFAALNGFLKIMFLAEKRPEEIIEKLEEFLGIAVEGANYPEIVRSLQNSFDFLDDLKLAASTNDSLSETAKLIISEAPNQKTLQNKIYSQQIIDFFSGDIKAQIDLKGLNSLNVESFITMAEHALLCKKNGKTAEAYFQEFGLTDKEHKARLTTILDKILPITEENIEFLSTIIGEAVYSASFDQEKINPQKRYMLTSELYRSKKSLGEKSPDVGLLSTVRTAQSFDNSILTSLLKDIYFEPSHEEKQLIQTLINNNALDDNSSKIREAFLSQIALDTQLVLTKDAKKEFSTTLDRSQTNSFFTECGDLGPLFQKTPDCEPLGANKNVYLYPLICQKTRNSQGQFDPYKAKPNDIFLGLARFDEPYKIEQYSKTQVIDFNQLFYNKATALHHALRYENNKGALFFIQNMSSDALYLKDCYGSSALALLINEQLLFPDNGHNALKQHLVQSLVERYDCEHLLEEINAIRANISKGNYSHVHIAYIERYYTILITNLFKKAEETSIPKLLLQLTVIELINTRNVRQIFGQVALDKISASPYGAPTITDTTTITDDIAGRVRAMILEVQQNAARGEAATGKITELETFFQNELREIDKNKSSENADNKLTMAKSEILKYRAERSIFEEFRAMLLGQLEIITTLSVSQTEDTETLKTQLTSIQTLCANWEEKVKRYISESALTQQQGNTSDIIVELSVKADTADYANRLLNQLKQEIGGFLRESNSNSNKQLFITETLEEVKAVYCKIHADIFNNIQLLDAYIKYSNTLKGFIAIFSQVPPEPTMAATTSSPIVNASATPVPPTSKESYTAPLSAGEVSAGNADYKGLLLQDIQDIITEPVTDTNPRRDLQDNDDQRLLQDYAEEIRDLKRRLSTALADQVYFDASNLYDRLEDALLNRNKEARRLHAENKMTKIELEAHLQDIKVTDAKIKLIIQYLKSKITAESLTQSLNDNTIEQKTLELARLTEINQQGDARLAKLKGDLAQKNEESEGLSHNDPRALQINTEISDLEKNIEQENLNNDVNRTRAKGVITSVELITSHNQAIAQFLINPTNTLAIIAIAEKYIAIQKEFLQIEELGARTAKTEQITLGHLEELQRFKQKAYSEINQTRGMALLRSITESFTRGKLSATTQNTFTRGTTDNQEPWVGCRFGASNENIAYIKLSPPNLITFWERRGGNTAETTLPNELLNHFEERYQHFLTFSQQQEQTERVNFGDMLSLQQTSSSDPEVPKSASPSPEHHASTIIATDTPPPQELSAHITAAAAVSSTPQHHPTPAPTVRMTETTGLLSLTKYTVVTHRHSTENEESPSSNKYRFMTSCYDSKSDIEKMMLQILVAEANKIDPNTTEDRLQQAIILKQQGGSEDFADKLSATFQKTCEKCGIMSGRQNSLEGLRLKFLPESVLNQINAGKDLFKPALISQYSRAIEEGIHKKSTAQINYIQT